MSQSTRMNCSCISDLSFASKWGRLAQSIVASFLGINFRQRPSVTMICTGRRDLSVGSTSQKHAGNALRALHAGF